MGAANPDVLRFLNYRVTVESEKYTYLIGALMATSTSI